MTGRAGRLDADDAGRLNYAALPAAVCADFTAAAFGCAAAIAFAAAVMALKLDGLGNAVGCFFECERNVAADIAAFVDSASSTATAEQVAE
jgi:hypothetical protein